jgi:hypothetical protein
MAANVAKGTCVSLLRGASINSAVRRHAPGMVIGSATSATPRPSTFSSSLPPSLHPTAMEDCPTSHSSQELGSMEKPCEPKVFSKKAQKKALKVARLEERKIERRVKEKAAKKEKKRQRAERIAAGEQVSEDERSQKRAKTNLFRKPFAARVVLDLGFDDKMSDKVGDY